MSLSVATTGLQIVPQAIGSSRANKAQLLQVTTEVIQNNAAQIRDAISKSISAADSSTRANSLSVNV